MKKISLMAVLLSIFSTATFANSGPLGENSQFKVLTKSDNKYEVIYVSDEDSDVRIYIINEDGRTVESNLVKDVASFRRTFDFSQMESGKYAVVVKNKEGTARETIDHKTYKETLKGFVVRIPEKQALKLHVGDFTKTQPVKVKIYDANDRIVHKDAISHDQAFYKVYNMTKAGPGEYRVVITNNGESKAFTHKID